MSVVRKRKRYGVRNAQTCEAWRESSVMSGKRVEAVDGGEYKQRLGEKCARSLLASIATSPQRFKLVVQSAKHTRRCIGRQKRRLLGERHMNRFGFLLLYQIFLLIFFADAN